MLKNWAANKLRVDIISRLGAITADGNVQITYAAATAGQRDTWLLNNADRVLFGISKANAVSNVYATSLATVDNAADKMTAAQLTLAKRLARTANPKLRPIRINNDEEWYVVFVPSLVFRDLMLDTDDHQCAAIRLEPRRRIIRSSRRATSCTTDLSSAKSLSCRMSPAPSSAVPAISAAHRPSGSPGHKGRKP